MTRRGCHAPVEESQQVEDTEDGDETKVDFSEQLAFINVWELRLVVHDLPRFVGPLLVVDAAWRRVSRRLLCHYGTQLNTWPIHRPKRNVRCDIFETTKEAKERTRATVAGRVDICRTSHG